MTGMSNECFYLLVCQMTGMSSEGMSNDSMSNEGMSNECEPEERTQISQIWGLLIESTLQLLVWLQS